MNVWNCKNEFEDTAHRRGLTKEHLQYITVLQVLGHSHLTEATMD